MYQHHNNIKVDGNVKCKKSSFSWIDIQYIQLNTSKVGWASILASHTILFLLLVALKMRRCIAYMYECDDDD